MNKIVDQFSKVDDIEVVQAQCLSIDDISYYEFLQLKKWDFDYISHSASADGETL